MSAIAAGIHNFARSHSRGASDEAARREFERRMEAEAEFGLTLGLSREELSQLHRRSARTAPTVSL